MPQKLVSYRLDEDILKLVEKYADGNKTNFVQTAIAEFIKSIVEDKQDAVQPQQEKDIQSFVSGDIQNPYLKMYIEDLKNQVIELKHNQSEEIGYLRNKIESLENRYDTVVDKSIKHFERIMESIDESRRFNYIPSSTGIRMEGVSTPSNIKTESDIKTTKIEDEKPIEEIIEEKLKAKEEKQELENEIEEVIEEKVEKKGFWSRMFS